MEMIGSLKVDVKAREKMLRLVRRSCNVCDSAAESC